MDAILTITLSREVFDALAGISGTSNARLVAQVDYFEDIRSAEERKANEPLEIVSRSVRVELSAPGSMQLDVGVPLNGSLKLSILTSQGSTALTRELTIADNKASYAFSKSDVEAAWKAEPEPVTSATLNSVRYAEFVPIGSVRPDFKKSQLGVLPLLAKDEAVLGPDGALGVFGFSKSRSSSVELDVARSAGLAALAWSTLSLGVDGRFVAKFELPIAAGQAGPAVLGWVWWLNGERSALGFVKDDLSKADRQPRIIPLPALQPATEGEAEPVPSAPCDCGPATTPPRDVSESELVNNPNIYAEDPGTFCKPFSNPERVISEKAFAVIARVQQPGYRTLGRGAPAQPAPAGLRGRAAGRAEHVAAHQERGAVSGAYARCAGIGAARFQ